VPSAQYYKKYEVLSISSICRNEEGPGILGADVLNIHPGYPKHTPSG
jgi:hypothetical protein